MSGGAYDYQYLKVLSLADDIAEYGHPHSDAFTPARKRVASVLRQAAELAKIVEWVDSGDTSPDDGETEIEQLLALWASVPE